MAGRVRPVGERVEELVQVALMLAVGALAGAAAFSHVHALAVAHGQPGWLAWADAAVLETMSISAGLEIRRRRRAGQHTGSVTAVLVAAVLLSLAAQVAEAERSVWGWTMAALPAVGFLCLAKIALTRTPDRTTPDVTPDPAPRVATTPDVVGPVGPPRPDAVSTAADPRPDPSDPVSAALSYLTEHPDLSGAQLGRLLGVSDRHARRLRARVLDLQVDSPPG